MKRFLLLLAAISAAAQERELGILAGAAYSPEPSLGGPQGVSSGLDTGAAAGIVLGQDLYSRVSGEIRYVFERQQAAIRSGDTRAAFAAQAHALHYDILLHTRPRGDHVRPYVAVGGGIKLYRGVGEEAAYQPLMQYAWLTRARDLKPMLSFGAGLKFRLAERIVGRIDLRDQLTPFPSKIITPAPGGTAPAILHDLVPTVGVSWLF